MTSCVLSLVFLVFFCFSVTAIGTTGIKVRITDRAQSVVKDFGLAFLNELVNHPFQDLTFHQCSLKRLTLTRFEVNPDQVVLNFQQNSRLQFQINNVDLTVQFEYDIKLCGLNIDRGVTTLTGGGLNLDIHLELMQNEGRLNVKMLDCEAGIDHLNLQSTGIIGRLLETLVTIFNDFTKSKLCAAINTLAINKANTILEALTMVSEIPIPESDKMVNPPGAISINYLLSENIAVTANSIDVSFTGLVFVDQANVADLTGNDPLFTEDNMMMAYVGISDLFFKSIAQTLFSIKAFQFTPHPNFLAESVLKGLGLSDSKSGVLVELDVVPDITITPAGVFVVVNANVYSSEERSENPEEQPLPVACRIGVKVNTNGNQLILSTVTSNTKCKVQPVTKIGKVLKPLVNLGLKSKKFRSLIKSMLNGIPIPLPEGLNLVDTKIIHHEGYLVVQGSLDFTPAGLQGVARQMAG